MSGRSPRPTPALIVAVTALVLALSGAALALPGKNSVQSNDIKRNAVKAKQIKANAVGGSEIAADAVSAGEVADGSLSDAEIADYESIGDSVVRVAATDGANIAAAQEAAPEVPLFAKGPLEIYAKCFHNLSADATNAGFFARTSADGSIAIGDMLALDGGNAATDFLNATTGENGRELFRVTATPAGNNTLYGQADFALAAPDGTALSGQLVAAAKNGTLTGGNGIYGDGKVCLFHGQISG